MCVAMAASRQNQNAPHAGRSSCIPFPLPSFHRTTARPTLFQHSSSLPAPSHRTTAADSTAKRGGPSSGNLY
ncbi:hypothetical protein BD626DRAFT_527272 [Schizophyllum amplum]|uniref:Uncharacterized protein n=1 Tax=Schizophyllum amplum TaxID=97359 RepID=A0A550BS77_9AGAR|nr:hypothetical protein BD626DRAFT_527272 [Auriculariopsis ampla]